jgi:hydroxypyruvate reductase
VPDLNQTARHVFNATLAGIDIPSAIELSLARSRSHLHVEGEGVDLAQFSAIRIVALGKAGFASAQGLCRALGADYPVEGLLVVPVAPPRELPGLRTVVAGHPVPDAGSFTAGHEVLKLLAQCNDRTLIFFLLSGGGSALCEQPLFPDVTLEDMQALHRALVSCGAAIDEMNAVRKHLSAVKGGRLAAAAPRAMKITLGVSDVPPGRESALGSGPTLPDPTTCADVYRIAAQYGLADRLAPALRARFEARAIPETPKAGDPVFARAQFSLVLGMRELFHHAHRATEAAGFVTICDNTTDDWPLDRARDFLLAQLDALRDANPHRPACMIADGEISCPVTGKGIGGRNSAFALACVEKIAGQPIAVLSAGTDGIDGNSPAAGAVADGSTLLRARALGLDPADFFRRSDAYNFFAPLGDTIIIGPTGNNLRDLRIFLASPKR